jgi:succinoglycan biosynthesis transport protein ExoP
MSENNADHSPAALALVGPVSNGFSHGALPAGVEQIAFLPAPSRTEPEEEAIDLSHHLWILKRHRWRILAFVAASVAGTIVVSSRLTPYYESTATVDVDRQMPAGVVGQEASARAAFNDSDQFLATQVRLIQSDSVLRPVVQRLNISAADIEAREPKLPTTRAEDAPIRLIRLKVTRPQNTYLLLIGYRSADPQLAADVANGIAQSYIEHTYDIRYRASAGLSAFMERQLDELRAKMERSAGALVQFEKELNVLNPEEKTSILSSRMLQLITEFTNAQADRVRKQAAFGSVESGTLEAAQASGQGEQLRKLTERLDEARERFASIGAQYGYNHPEYKKSRSQLSELERQVEVLKKNIGQRVDVEYREAINRESMLQKAVAETKAEFDNLNARSFEYKALKQEAESNKGLYEELIRKIKEAGINASFQNSSIRLADPARPAPKPVFPDLTLNALLALLFSSVLGMVAAILSDGLDKTVRDPEQITHGLKTEVLGSLPVVKAWRGRLPGSKNGASKLMVRPAGSTGQAGEFEEAIRTLRDSILLPNLDRPPRSLLFTSATPREGKTTTAVHLAVAHSRQKRKTLIIDGDQRRPGVHRHLGVTNDSGLSSVVNGEVKWREAVQTAEAFPNLAVLAAGPPSFQAVDCVGATLKGLLKEAMAEYDLVILDSPPLLGFAEPLQMAAMVDGVVVVTLAGQTSRNAVSSVLTSLKRLKVNVIGVALNEVRAEMSDRYYYYGYYGKYYSRYYKPVKS